MRVKLDLDNELVAEAARVSRITDLQALIREALKVLIAENRRRSLLDLQGKIEFAPNYDHKQLR